MTTSSVLLHPWPTSSANVPTLRSPRVLLPEGPWYPTLRRCAYAQLPDKGRKPMLRLKRALLIAVPSSKSWMLAANILLATSVASAGKARAPELNGNAFMEVDPIDPRYRSMVALGSTCDPTTTVQTDNGAVCGIVVTGINAWLGIPFAAPPVEDLRWAPPEAAAPWSGVREATAYASQCLQATGGDEDCLYLNVWAPPGANGLAVMAHIHGGGFRGGSGAGDFSLLSSTGNVVVVSLNYRLNIFGFAAHPAF